MLVFFALFGVFLTQYLPLWMAQNESQFTYQAQASMETLKQYVDDQAIFGGPRTYAVPFTLSSQGVALFAQPTQGGISFNQGGCVGGFASNGTPLAPTACSFQLLKFSVGGSNSAYQPLTLESISNYFAMQLPNRYYPSQSLVLENDAVVSLQTAVPPRMLVAPPFNLSYTPSNTTLTASYVVLTGNSSSYSSQGSKDVFTSLVSNLSYSSAGRFPNLTNGRSPLPFNVTFEVGTRNACAWYSFLSTVVVQSGIPKELGSGPYSTTGYTLSPSSAPPASSCSNPSGKTTDLTLNLYLISFAQVYSGVSRISFSAGGL